MKYYILCIILIFFISCSSNPVQQGHREPASLAYGDDKIILPYVKAALEKKGYKDVDVKLLPPDQILVRVLGQTLYAGGNLLLNDDFMYARTVNFKYGRIAFHCPAVVIQTISRGTMISNKEAASSDSILVSFNKCEASDESLEKREIIPND
jgi:hypothetical protein